MVGRSHHRKPKAASVLTESGRGMSRRGRKLTSSKLIAISMRQLDKSMAAMRGHIDRLLATLTPQEREVLQKRLPDQDSKK